MHEDDGHDDRPTCEAATELATVVCFDFWNTLVHERKPGALVAARIPVIREALTAMGHDRSDDVLRAAHAVAQTAFEQSWRTGEQFRTDQAARLLIDELSLEPALAPVVQEAFERGGSLADVCVVDGARAAVAAARDAGARTAIVCDVGLTPSFVLRSWLADHGFSGLFDCLSFSDQTGRYKPHRGAFEHVRASLGLAGMEGFHVGDRRLTDVAGAVAAGLVPIRFRGVYDDTGEGPEAPHVVDSMAELADLLHRALG